VEGEVSGVMFTTDPMDPDRTLVSAAWGLCEGVVQGSVPCDTLRIDGQGDVELQIATKDLAISLVDGVPTEVPVPIASQAEPCLSTAVARELSALGRQLEQGLGGPQDIEWTWNGHLVVLQARPITQAIPRGTKLLWDNSNIIESYCGLTGPLTYSFASRAYTIVYQLFSAVMGVDRDTIQANSAVFPRMIGLIRGRIYYNLGAWYTVVSLLPGYRWNREFMEEMMGVSEAGGELEAGEEPTLLGRFADLGQLLRLLIRMAVRTMRLDKDVAAFTEKFEAAVDPYKGQAIEGMGPHALLDAYADLERRLLWAWHTPIVNDFFVMIFFGLLKKLSASWIDEDAELHNALLAGEGGMESTAPTVDALRLAAAIREDPQVLGLFASGLSDEEVDLEARRIDWLGEALSDWIERYGDRCADELKLEMPTFRQEPVRLVTILRGYVSGRPMDPSSFGAGERTMRAEAEAQVAAALSGWRTRVFGFVLRMARVRVRDRENLRFLRTRIFGLVRRIFVTLGEHMQAADALDEARDVFHLTVDEAFGWVRGTTVTTNLRGLAALRMEEYARWAQEPAPADRFRTWGPVWRKNSFLPTVAPPPPGEGLHGLPACPGVVEGTVRRIEDPRSEAPLQDEILVAYRTDPGWVPLFPNASAILVERGSLLSHSAVVAREMGIPTVVGIAGLMDSLSSGDRIRVDAGAGTVEILSRVGP
jgi:phosphohistidine swiveling domain-containing protein